MIVWHNMLNKIKNNSLVVVFILFSVSFLHGLGYKKIQLQNGMEAYIIKTNNPIVTHVVTYGVGSMEENSSQEGLAHLLEHVMFLGSNRYSKDKLSSVLKNAGASYNAYTSNDLTLYYFTFPKESLEQFIKIEADRMQWLTIDNAIVENEKSVVNKERDMYNNKPYSVFYALVNQTLYPTTNYGRSVIGYPSTFNNLNGSDVRKFYEKWYNPNNAKVFIIGDINVDIAYELINKNYGKINNRTNDYNRVNYIEVPYQANITVDFKEQRINQDIIMKSYLVPSVISDSSVENQDSYSLILLANMLSSHSGRLYKSLVLDKKLALDIVVNYDPYTKGNTSFSIVVVPNQGLDKELVFMEAEKELTRILASGFTSSEVKHSAKKIRDQMEYLKELDSEYLFSLARYVNAGLTVEQFNNLGDNLYSVSSNTVNKVAKDLLSKYFVIAKASKTK